MGHSRVLWKLRRKRRTGRRVQCPECPLCKKPITHKEAAKDITVNKKAVKVHVDCKEGDVGYREEPPRKEYGSLRAYKCRRCGEKFKDYYLPEKKRICPRCAEKMERPVNDEEGNEYQAMA